MSTIQCQGCGKRIIDRGENCPHCGNPIHQDNNLSKNLKELRSQINNDENLDQKNQEAPQENMLITCKACGEKISKNAFSCPHCGEPNAQISSSIASSKESMLGFVGATLLMIGAFLPAINIPIRGSISYIANGKGDGMIIVIIALLAFYFIYKKKKLSLMLSGGFSLVIIAYGFMQVLQKVAEVQKGAEPGIGQAILGGVGVGSAFGVTAVGAILIIISSFMMKK